MLRERQKSQPHDAVELRHRAKGYEEGSPAIFLLASKIIGEEDTCEYKTVTLGIEDAGVCLYGNEPKQEELLASAEKRLPYAPIWYEGYGQHPQESAKLIGQHGEWSHEKREQGTIEEIVAVFRIDDIQGQLLPSMPKRVIEDGIVEVELSLQPYSQPGYDGHDKPDEKYCPEIGKEVSYLICYNRVIHLYF